MTAVERTLHFDCAGETLVGILSLPPQDVPRRAIGVVIVVGGPQFRIGSHRQFVLLARRLAAAGHPVLRFDCRGMGDSGGLTRKFDEIDADIAAAVDTLFRQAPELAGVTLWGLCDGASASLLYLDSQADSKVLGVCLVNPWVRSEASLARTHIKHYYLQRLLQREFWHKLLHGDITGQAWRSLLGNLRLLRASDIDVGGQNVSYQSRMARACERFDGQLLLLLSGVDFTAREFLEVSTGDATWSRIMKKPETHRHDLEGADHTFSTREAQQQVEALTLEWLDRVENF